MTPRKEYTRIYRFDSLSSPGVAPSLPQRIRRKRLVLHSPAREDPVISEGTWKPLLDSSARMMIQPSS